MGEAKRRRETTAEWTTQIQPELTRPYGVEEIHSVYFAPPGWKGKGAAVSLGIPECELILCMLAPDGELVTMVNRPKANRDIAAWIGFACKLAIEHHAPLSFNCDTVEQTETAVRTAAVLLPGYRRIALERMYDQATRVADRLS